MMDANRTAYREEALELLTDMEQALLELEQDTANHDLVARIFRQMHTIKGSGAMFGFDAIAAFTHHIENTYDLVREGKLQVTRDLINHTLAARDHILNLLDAETGGPPVDAAAGEAVLANFRALAGAASTANAAAGQRRKQENAPEPAFDATYRIRFRPPRNAFLTGTNLIALLAELRSLGTCDVFAHTDAYPDLERFDYEQCYTWWDVLLTTSSSTNEIRGVFIFVEDDSEISITPIAPDENGEWAPRRLGEILADRGDAPARAIEQVAAAFPRIGEKLVEARVVGQESVEAALCEQSHVATARQKKRAVEAASNIRVPAEKLDGLVNVVGELVTVQARLSQLASNFGDPEIVFVAEELERVTAKLRDNTMSIRMLPIGATFAKFRRMVRDLARDLGKNVELVTEGDETELDKTVIDRLNDPLVHMIRNAVDHGIEPAAARLAANKPAQGTVRLSAVHAGGHVLIRIEDDGAGLDRDAIRAKAIEKGLLSPGAELEDHEIFAFILKPGFSTAREITEVSGRGVGMDVVQRSIESLQASLEISSRKGEGASITMKLPLTLAIIDGLLVTIGAQYFVLPLANILECIELPRREIHDGGGRRFAAVRGEMIPYVDLRQYFGITHQEPPLSQVMIADTQSGKFGFVVDHVIGDHQTVIKRLDGLYKDVETFSGATILGDGTVALILDLEKLAKAIIESQRSHAA